MKSDYYLFEPYYKYLNNQEVYAQTISFHENYDIQISLLKPKPINSMPLITFSYFENNPPLLDYLLSDGTYILISRKLEVCFYDMGVAFTTYSSKIIGNQTGKDLKLDYSIFHPLMVIEAVDREKSDMPSNSIKINRVVLKGSVIRQAIPLLRLADLGGYILVHKSLKTELIKRKITGCRFKNLDDFSSWKDFDTTAFDTEYLQKKYRL